MFRKTLLGLTICIAMFSSCNNKPEVDPNERSPVSVYPNPTLNNAIVSVFVPDGQLYVLKVFSPGGKLIMETARPDLTHAVSLQDKEAGTYNVVVEIGNKTYTKKLIKLSSK